MLVTLTRLERSSSKSWGPLSWRRQKLYNDGPSGQFWGRPCCWGLKLENDVLFRWLKFLCISSSNKNITYLSCPTTNAFKLTIVTHILQYKNAFYIMSWKKSSLLNSKLIHKQHTNKKRWILLKLTIENLIVYSVHISSY